MSTLTSDLLLTNSKPKGGGGSVIPVVDFLSQVVLRGKRDVNIAAGVQEARASVGIDRISEITLKVYDPGFKQLRAGRFDLGASCDFRRFKQEITRLETSGGDDDNGQVTLRCRAAAIGRLKRRRGTKILRDASPTDFVEKECKEVGVKVVAQTSHKRRQVARDTRKSEVGSGGKKPSSWTTFERLARELGYVVFESAGTIYFGQPSWLRKRDEKPAIVRFGTGTEDDAIGIPRFVDEMDSDTGISVSFEVPRSRVDEFMPGGRVKLRFEPWNEDTYLIKQLDFPIAGEGYATVVAGKPVDPKPQPPPKKVQTKAGGSKGGGSGGGARPDATLGALLRQAGFEGRALEIAAGVAIAESGGTLNGRLFVRASALGDQSLTNAKWGPSVGIFQIRSLNHPFEYQGLDRLRIRSKLTFALYNAKVAYKMSDGGRDWSAWSAFTSGRHRQYIGKTGAIVFGWGGNGSYESAKPDPQPSGGGGGGGGGTSPTGRQSAFDFVNLCLRQAGDTYVYGAEAALTNPNPEVFDCSELIQWAAHRVGCFMPDGSSNQVAHMRNRGTLIGVDAALQTRGAVLWIPGHVAVSLGGRTGTIEATNREYGVRRWGPGRSFSWQAGGKVPGMRYG